jgi:uncharacterized protein (UPF0548 family)
MRLVRPTDPIAIERLVASLYETRPTYIEIGASLVCLRPEGFRHDHYQALLGRGVEVFHRAANGLKSWKAHTAPGIRVFPQGEEIRAGATVVVTLGTPFLALAAPCRIVGVIDEKTRWGFAYGTLPGHPEQGEEAFVVSISPDETVLFEIVAFSRPGDPLVRLAGPLGRAIQKRGTNGYLRALQEYVTAEHGKNREDRQSE